MLVKKEQKKISLKFLANLQFLKSGSNYVNGTHNPPVKEYVSSRKIVISTHYIVAHRKRP